MKKYIVVGCAVACIAVFWDFIYGLPDLDIKLLGIGKHRHFLTHSCLIPFLLYLAQRRAAHLVQALLSVGVIATGAVLGVHLFDDTLQTKSVVFWPFFHHLLENTSLDDRIWEGSMSALCFFLAGMSLSRVLGERTERGG
jgi:hypothetical protein